MDNSLDSMQFRTLERRHMIAVKTALACRVSAQPDHADDSVLACVDYLEYIMGRFVQQGIFNINRLREAVAPEDVASLGIINDINSILERTRKELGQLIAARDSRGHDERADRKFVDACRVFLVFYDQHLASRKDPAQDIVQKYFDPEEYWRLSNDVTDQSIRTERELFARTGLGIWANDQRDPG